MTNGLSDPTAWCSIDANLPFAKPTAPEAKTGGKRETDTPQHCERAAPNPAAAAVDNVVPPNTAAAALVNVERGRQTFEFYDHNSGAEQARPRVGVPRNDSVPCCRCPARLKVSYLGYGDMVRRVEAAGWRYRPARGDHDRAWCPQCQNHAGSAAP